jgi:hypothetical protein
MHAGRLLTSKACMQAAVLFVILQIIASFVVSVQAQDLLVDTDSLDLPDVEARVGFAVSINLANALRMDCYSLRGRLSAQGAGTDSLPSWLKHDENACILEGVPPAQSVGQIYINLTVSSSPLQPQASGVFAIDVVPTWLAEKEGIHVVSYKMTLSERRNNVYLTQKPGGFELDIAKELARLTQTPMQCIRIISVQYGRSPRINCQLTCDDGLSSTRPAMLAKQLQVSKDVTIGALFLVRYRLPAFLTHAGLDRR